MDKKKKANVHVHMKYARILNLICGLWPIESTGYKLKLYNMYFYVSFTYYLTYDITQGAMVYISRGNFMEMAENLGVLIVYVAYIYKIRITKSKSIRDMVQKLKEQEGHILENADEEIRKIYMEYAESTGRIVFFYFIVGTIATVVYFARPPIENYLRQPETKYLIFPSWFPFDTNEHYWIAYSIQAAAGLLGYSYIVFQGTLYCSFLIFFVGQLHIMRHIFKNITHYISKFSDETGIPYVKAQEYFVKICIKQHQQIIRSVRSFDESVKTFLLLDFATSSLQLSLLVVQLIDGTEIIERCAQLWFLLTLCYQLVFFYWNAHEIIVQSTGIANAVFESDWYKLELPVQKLLTMVIMRAQKPMSLSIGPFYEARVDAVVSLYKAIYSYVALIAK